jgi:hypothetical protein
MTDAEFEAAKARVHGFAERWTPLLGLDDWDISWEYNREPPDKEREIAHCAVDWEYEQATVTWSITELLNDECDDEKLERIVVHELAHIILREMREDTKTKINHEERVATRLSKAFIRTREVGADDGNSEGG